MKEERLIDLLSPLEKVTLANEFSSLGATYFTLYLTLLSGYLVVAFLAGRKLTKSQVTTVNWVFILSAIFFTLSTLGNFIFSIGYYMAAPWRESILQGFYLMGALDIVMALAMVAGIFASLKFMKNIRESKPE
jgi:hypothetical protein